MKEKDILTLLFILDIVLIVISILLHMLGIFLLFKRKRRKNIQVILIHLSFSEITVQVFRFTSAFYFYLFEHNEEVLGYQILRSLTIQGWCVCYVMIMITVALDPLLVVILKTNYSKYVKRNSLFSMLATCWAIGITYALLNFTISYKTRELIAAKFTFPIITTIFIVFSILAYTMIYKHVKDRNIPRISVLSQAHRGPTLKFRVPVLIILTFFIFVTLPSVVQIAIQSKLTKIYYLLLAISYSVGFICDALIYLFLHPSTKRLLLSFYKFKRKENAVSVIEVSSRMPSASSPNIVRNIKATDEAVVGKTIKHLNVP